MDMLLTTIAKQKDKELGMSQLSKNWII